MSRGRRVRLLFVDEGAYHAETIAVPNGDLGSYDRLIDYIREDPELLKQIHVDLDRLCAAFLEE